MSEFTLEDIVSNSKVIPEDYKIPTIPHSLLSAIITVDGGTHKVSAVKVIVTDKDDDKTENKRFYVDDTDLIERRFLHKDTITFENQRDVDPFASAVLYTTMFDCIYNIPTIKSYIHKRVQQMFLEKGTLVSSSEKKDIYMMLDENKDTKKLRDIALKEWSISKDDTVEIFEKYENNDKYMLLMFSIGLCVPIVVEQTDGTVWNVGYTPAKETDNIYWIRQVTDGYLCIMKTAVWAEERLRNNDTLLSKQVDLRERKTLISKLKVNELKSHLTTLGGTPGKMKKKELEDDILRRSLWGNILVK